MRNVTVNKAKNGYTVSCYGMMGDNTVICKTMEEVKTEVEKMLNKKEEKPKRMEEVED